MSKARNIWSDYKREYDAVEFAAPTTPRSERGASMPLALLLFLICAMAAAIVLAASTATAGRASDLAESDQLYYSITSAANAFRDELFGEDGKGHSVTVAVKAPSVGTTEEDAVLSVMRGDEPVLSGASYSVLERAALKSLIGSDDPDADLLNAAWGNWSTTADFSDVSSSYDLTCTDESSLALEVTAEVDGDGTLSFTFSGSNASTGAAKLVLSCNGDYEANSINVTESGVEYTIKYVAINWTPTTLEKA